MNVSIPYNLTEEQLVLEPTSLDSSLAEGMVFIADHVSWSDEEALERIFRSVTLLHQKFPDRNLGDCLETALIWELG